MHIYDEWMNESVNVVERVTDWNIGLKIDLLIDRMDERQSEQTPFVIDSLSLTPSDW